MNFFSRYYWHVLLVLIASSLQGGLYALFHYTRGRKTSVPETARPQSQPRRRAA